MASTSLPEAAEMLPEAAEMLTADAMIAEFIRHQEAQVALLKRMFGSSHAVAVASTKDAEVDLKKEMLATRGDSMQSGQDGLAVQPEASMEEAGEITEEGSAIERKEVLLEKMHLREVIGGHSSPWGKALRLEDCKSLMAQLREDPYLMLQTYEGRSVLHVASIYGCKPLVQHVLKTGDNVVLFAVDEKTKLTAHDINTYIVGQKYLSFSMPSTMVDLDKSHNGELVGLIRDIIKQLVLEETVHGISDVMVSFGWDPLYNFDNEHIEFIFHHVCCKLSQIFWGTKFMTDHKWDVIEGNSIIESNKHYIHFLWLVIGRCLKTKEDQILKCLFEFQDWKGNPPFQTILFESDYLEQDVDFMISTIKDMLRPSPNSFQIYVNARDARGWTFLHKCAAMGYHKVVKRLVKEESIDLNPMLPTSNATPLHLAILHNHSRVVKALIAKDKIDVNAIFTRSIAYGQDDAIGIKRLKNQWSPLQLAAVMGLSDVVCGLLTKVEEIYDVGKRKNKVVHQEESPLLKVHDDEVSALHMAASSGIPEALLLFLNDVTFDPSKLTKKEKRSALHFAIDATAPHTTPKKPDGTRYHRPVYGHPVLKIMDFASLFHHTNAIKDCKNDSTVNKKFHSITMEEYSGKITCVNMLLHSGIDVWQQDAQKNYAEPGSQASVDVRLWWSNRLVQGILEAKKNLNDAGNAIFVVGALVATASYVGPLQPPLGFAPDSADPTNFDLVQATKLGIRVFVVSNCLSFYLAIGSIIYAIAPSIPMPQEGVFEEWQRSRRSVALAMGFLLLAILGVLVSFAAASNVGMSNYYSWRHVGLAFYPTLVGGIACLFGILIFYVRVLRLIFENNKKIRAFFQLLDGV